MNGLKFNIIPIRLDIKNKYFYSIDSKTLKQVAQRNCRCPIIGSI